MNTRIITLLAAMFLLSAGSLVMGAEPTPTRQAKPSAASADAMPAVATAGSATPGSATPGSATPGPATPVTQPADKQSPDKAPSEAAKPASRSGRNGSDRLDLDTTVVTGNRELPKVLYIVPWKRSDIGDLPAQPLNSLLDEVLTPVDRDVFRREVTYYEAMAGEKGKSPGDSAKSAAGSEK